MTKDLLQGLTQGSSGFILLILILILVFGGGFKGGFDGGYIVYFSNNIFIMRVFLRNR